MTQIDESVTKVYDDVLSSFKHVSSLCIEKENFTQAIKMLDSASVELDKDIVRAHQCFIGDVVTTAVDSDFSEAMQCVMYPNFKVKTYVPNVYYYFSDNYSLEKSVMMLKKYVLNLIIDDEENKLDTSSRVLNILQIEKIDIGSTHSFYTIRRYAIGLKMFYNLYLSILKNRGFGMPKQDEMVYLNNLAIDQGLMVMEPFETSKEGEFIIKNSDYEMFKKYIKNKYKISFNEKCIMPNGVENTVWLYKDVEKFDNRPLVDIDNKDTVVPLSYQRNLSK